MAEEIPEQPEMPLGQLFMPIILLIGMSFILMNDGLRLSMAGLAGSVLEPSLPFHDLYFVPTVLVVGSSIMIVNTVFRSLFMDPMQQAHLNHRNKQLRKLMNEARLSRDHVRVEKIQKMQMHLMPESTKLQMNMMKPMMFTMIFVIGIFSWMYVMVEEFRVDHVSLPWNAQWGFNGRILLFPAWILAYITLSAPLGRIVDRHIKLFRYRSHPLVVAGDKLEEPLLVILKEKKAKKQNNRRTQRSQRRNRGASEVIEDDKEIENKPAKGVNFTRILTGISCRSCGGDDVIRTDSGRNRCQVCLDEWRR
ncbi:MAG: EMC3/TMCO1 family protein [Candidatus Thalassarchaeaceae archaeon]|nr:EMC3/TMCO1 family protein [Candidatus Thalassarchaeaceae archaeon]